MISTIQLLLISSYPSSSFLCTPQNLPSWSYWTGPSTVIGGLTPIINDGAGGGATAAQIAAGAAATSVITNVYATAASSSSLLPALRDVACYSSSSPSGGSASYNCMAVGDFGYVVRASYPAVTMSNTVMTSTMSWSAVNVTQVSVPSGFLDLYGITWCDCSAAVSPRGGGAPTCGRAARASRW